MNQNGNNFMNGTGIHDVNTFETFGETYNQSIFNQESADMSITSLNHSLSKIFLDITGADDGKENTPILNFGYFGETHNQSIFNQESADMSITSLNHSLSKISIDKTGANDGKKNTPILNFGYFGETYNQSIFDQGSADMSINTLNHSLSKISLSLPVFSTEFGTMLPRDKLLKCRVHESVKNWSYVKQSIPKETRKLSPFINNTFQIKFQVPNINTTGTTLVSIPSSEFDRKKLKLDKHGMITLHICTVPIEKNGKWTVCGYFTDRSDNFKKHQVSQHYVDELKTPLNCPCVFSENDQLSRCEYRSYASDDLGKHIKKTDKKKINYFNTLTVDEYTEILKKNEGFIFDTASKIMTKWTAEYHEKTRSGNKRIINKDWIEAVDSGKFFPALPDLRKGRNDKAVVNVLKFELDLNSFLVEMAGWLVQWKP